MADDSASTEEMLNRVVREKRLPQDFQVQRQDHSTLINRSLGITGEEQALVQDKANAGTAALAPQPGQMKPVAETPPVADNKRQIAFADAATSSQNPGQHIPTLIDADIETLYSSFQKR